MADPADPEYLAELNETNPHAEQPRVQQFTVRWISDTAAPTVEEIESGTGVIIPAAEPMPNVIDRRGR